MRATFQILTLVVTVVLIAAGCGSKSTKNRPMTDEDRWQGYARLRGMSLSHREELRAHRERLEQLRQTPVSLQAHAGTAVIAKQGWLKEIPQQTLEMVFKRCKQLYPQCLESRASLQAAHKYRQRYDKQRTRLHQGLQAPKFALPIRPSRGWLDDNSYVQHIWIAICLEGMLGAEYLDRGQIDDAIGSLKTMWSWCNRVVGQQHLICRLEGATMRREILRLLDAIANHKKSGNLQLVQLLEMMEQQLKDWPADRRAWIGDQSDGLIAYELIRDGYLLSVLDANEIKKMSKGVGVDAWVSKITGSIDSDQWYYVTTMQKVIECCDLPYFQRKKTLAGISQDLEKSRGTDSYPFIAGEILLTNTLAGHRRQAKDKARCDAWAVVLANLTKREPPKEVGNNPLTGQPYLVQTIGEHLQIEVDENELVKVKR